MSSGAGSTAASGVVLGIITALLLWFLNYVDPITMVFLAVFLGALFGIAVGVPARSLNKKILKERKKLGEAPAFYPAAPAAQAPPQPPLPVQPSTASPAPPVATAASILVAQAPPAPAWPLFEPLCFLETSRERDLLEIAGAAGLPPQRLLVFLTQTAEVLLPEYGLAGVEAIKLSRVEGEDVVSPGDLDRLGYLIEKHFAKGQGYKVVLPSVEALVEAAGVKNVRRLLDVARELAQGSAGSLLLSIFPKALPEEQVAILERGATLLAPVRH
ncbi:MAG: DUF835 domain-containing protein [Candidatus Thermoplasmatota archaeon]|jgi:hypothetical protein|nr:DUF835 domain-containing protein [Candidatus Thermoplasmatota archaeon]